MVIAWADIFYNNLYFKLSNFCQPSISLQNLAKIELKLRIIFKMLSNNQTIVTRSDNSVNFFYLCNMSSSCSLGPWTPNPHLLEINFDPQDPETW